MRQEKGNVIDDMSLNADMRSACAPLFVDFIRGYAYNKVSEVKTWQKNVLLRVSFH